MPYVASKEIQRKFGVGPTTVRSWADDGKLEFIRTKGGQRRYLALPDGSLGGGRERAHGRDIIYGRVSSRKQRDDLERQCAVLRENYPDHELITDIGSGINFERPNFKKILESLFDGNIRTVVVAHRERFTRFGFSFFEWLFMRFGGRLISHRSPKDGSSDRRQELHEDLMAIVTVFSAKYHGRRKYRTTATHADMSGSDGGSDG